MNEMDNYIINDKEAKEALQALEANQDTAAWLYHYSELFDDLTYAVGDLPLLADCNFEGQHFENISKFCSTYENLLDEFEINEN